MPKAYLLLGGNPYELDLSDDPIEAAHAAVNALADRYCNDVYPSVLSAEQHREELAESDLDSGK